MLNPLPIFTSHVVKSSNNSTMIAAPQAEGRNHGDQEAMAIMQPQVERRVRALSEDQHKKNGSDGAMPTMKVSTASSGQKRVRDDEEEVNAARAQRSSNSTEDAGSTRGHQGADVAVIPMTPAFTRFHKAAPLGVGATSATATSSKKKTKLSENDEQEYQPQEEDKQTCTGQEDEGTLHGSKGSLSFLPASMSLFSPCKMSESDFLFSATPFVEAEPWLKHEQDDEVGSSLMFPSSTRTKSPLNFFDPGEEEEVFSCLKFQSQWQSNTRSCISPVAAVERRSPEDSLYSTPKI